MQKKSVAKDPKGIHVFLLYSNFIALIIARHTYAIYQCRHLSAGKNNYSVT